MEEMMLRIQEKICFCWASDGDSDGDGDNDGDGDSEGDCDGDGDDDGVDGGSVDDIKKRWEASREL